MKTDHVILDDHVLLIAEWIRGDYVAPDLKERPLTPSEVAAYLLGAPASSFPVDPPADDEEQKP